MRYSVIKYCFGNFWVCRLHDYFKIVFFVRVLMQTYFTGHWSSWSVFGLPGGKMAGCFPCICVSRALVTLILISNITLYTLRNFVRKFVILKLCKQHVPRTCLLIVYLEIVEHLLFLFQCTACKAISSKSFWCRLIFFY